MTNEAKFEFKLTREERKFINELPDEESKQRAISNLQRNFEYGNSCEGVAYNFGLLAVPIRLESTIIKAVQKLLPKVKDFVYARCDFRSVSPDGGECYYKRTAKPWIIILGETVDESVVAHEIAHAFLGHKCSTPFGDDVETGMSHETEACNLAKRWGFSGNGTKVASWLIEAEKRLKSKTQNDSISET